jgi:hypothetical protein
MTKPKRADAKAPAPTEREQIDRLAEAHAALAAAQDRSYWLDRWGVDLNSLMRRPSARRARAALRLVRELKRGTVTVERYAQRRLDTLRASAAEDEMAAGAPIHQAAGSEERAAEPGEAAGREQAADSDSTQA